MSYEMKYFSLNEVLIRMTMQCNKISKIHDDYKILANGNAILHLIFSFARRQFAICYRHRRDSILELFIILVLFFLPYKNDELRWKTQNIEERHNILLRHFHHNKIRSVWSVSPGLLFWSYEKRSVVSSSYRVDRKGRISITISIPTRSGIHKLFRVLWTFLTLAQDCCVIFSNL